MKRFVIGDVHGRLKALIEVLKKAKFNYDKDKLIVLGDIADGGYDTYMVVEELLKIKHLVLVLGNHDCVDSKTECLTKRGWITYDKIKLNDKIYSYDSNLQIGIWSEINTIIKKEYKGKLIQIKNNNVDMLVTPTHRIFHKSKSKRKNPNSLGPWKKYEYTLAKNLKGSFDFYTGITQYTDEIKYNISDNMLKLCAWIITDGSVPKLHKTGYIIWQSKQPYVDEIRQLLEDEKYKYREDIKQSKVEEICGRKLKNKPKPGHIFYIKGTCGKVFPITQKYKLPQWIYGLNKKQAKLFIETLIKGDGNFCSNKNSVVLYGKKELLDDVQKLCCLNGFRATYRKISGQDRLNITFKNTVAFQTSMVKKNSNVLQEKDYNGIVWCLNVHRSNFLVRRNGKTYFTGNCWFMNHIKHGWAEEIWLQQGGGNTLKSYGAKVVEAEYVSDESKIDMSGVNIPVTHQHFFNKGVYYYVEDNMLFVHGGINPAIPKLSSQSKHDLVWDRHLIQYAKTHKVQDYDKVFVGHTTTELINGGLLPIQYNNLYCMDTGAGWTGKLSIMDIDSGKYWQSKIQRPAIRDYKQYGRE